MTFANSPWRKEARIVALTVFVELLAGLAVVLALGAR